MPRASAGLRGAPPGRRASVRVRGRAGGGPAGVFRGDGPQASPSCRRLRGAMERELELLRRPPRAARCRRTGTCAASRRRDRLAARGLRGAPSGSVASCTAGLRSPRTPLARVELLAEERQSSDRTAGFIPPRGTPGRSVLLLGGPESARAPALRSLVLSVWGANVPESVGDR